MVFQCFSSIPSHGRLIVGLPTLNSYEQRTAPVVFDTPVERGHLRPSLCAFVAGSSGA